MAVCNLVLLEGINSVLYKTELFLVVCFVFNLPINGQSVGTPTSATVCDGRTTTLTCDISQSGGVAPVWRVFATSDTSGSPVETLNNGENSPPYNYPAAGTGDTEARLEVAASSSIDGYHFRCRLDLVSPVNSPGTGTITVTDIPSCPTSCTRSRNEDFTNVSVSCQQTSNTPPVTSTTVTYCPTSSPNCGNGRNCTTSPCTISGLNACEDYQLTVIPNNKCGSPTGCTGTSVMSEGQDMPSCPNGFTVENVDSINCFVLLTWQTPPNTPPVTSTTVTYCPTSSPNCGNSMNCTSPCIICGLDPGTEYQFMAIPNNNCGSPTGCTGNMASVTTLDSCTASYRQPSEEVSNDAAFRTSLGIGVAVPIAVLIVVNIISVVVAVLVTRHCYKKTSQKSSPSKGEDVYEQMERQKPCQNIVMTDNPAYGPVEKGNKT